MSVKEQFLQALDEVPEGLTEFTTKTIPTLVSFSSPSDVDAAIIAQGKLAYNLNLILKEFEGMTPIELFLRIGQRNTVVKALLLAALQYVSHTELHDFKIFAPTEGQEFPGGQQEITFQAEVTTGVDELVSLVVDVTGADSTSLAPEEDGSSTYIGTLRLPLDGMFPDPPWNLAFEAVFTAEFDGGEGNYPVSKAVNFTISEAL